MHAGRIAAIVIGGLLALAGLIGLAVDVTFTNQDHTVMACGTGFSTDYSAADREAGVDEIAAGLSGIKSHAENTYRVDCATAVADRRLWAWPLVGVGLVAVGIAAFPRRRSATSSSGGQVVSAGS